MIDGVFRVSDQEHETSFSNDGRHATSKFQMGSFGDNLARLAAKRALLYMERPGPKDDGDDGWALLNAHHNLENSLYCI